MAWRWHRTPPPTPEELGAILPRLTCQVTNMRRELARLSREIMAVHVALERVAAQIDETDRVPLLTTIPPLPPEEFTTERRQR